MKKAVYLILAGIITLSCSKEENTSLVESLLTPPEWLYGTWEYTSENITQMEIEVSTDNVTLHFPSGITYDIVNQAKSIDSDPNGSFEIEESKATADIYQFTVSIFANNSEQQRNTYRFERINSETILFFQNSVSTELTRR